MEITWNITDMKRDISGVVKIIYYCIAVKDANSNYEDVYNYTLNVWRKSDSPEIINYQDLTQEEVIIWIKNKLGEEKVTQLESRLIEKTQRISILNVNLNLETGLPW